MYTGRQSGVALAIVVWFLAAMSLLVAGIVFQAKADTRLAQAHIARAKAAAAGDGAIQLMMAALKTNQLKGFRGRGVPNLALTVGAQQVNVFLVPTGGLVDLNGATPDLLAALFASAANTAGIDPKMLADNVVKWRNQSDPVSRQAHKFSAIEDLLHIEGVTRTIFESVRDAVVVGPIKTPGVDWMSAPPAVLQALSGNNSDTVSKIVGARGSGAQSGMSAPRGLNSRFQSGGAGSSYRVDAYVTVGDKQWLRRRWVNTGSGDNDGMLPWRYTRTEPARAVFASSNEK